MHGVLPDSRAFEFSRKRRFTLIAMVMLASAVSISAGRIDTVIIGAGTAGPYGVGTDFIDSSSISVRWTDTTGAAIPGYRFADSSNTLLFDTIIHVGRRISVSYATHYLGLPKITTLFRKIRLDSALRADTGRSKPFLPGLSAPAARQTPETGGLLKVGGYKSIAVSMGNKGQMNIRQELDITASGQVTPYTELSAHVTDAGTSIEGSTREIGDLDLVYITLSNPRFGGTLGDQYVSWIADGMLSGSKKIKGISGRLTLGPVAVSAFGAMAGGVFATQVIAGSNGVQGPYRFLGNGETAIITPVRGTVKLTVDGATLKEGEESDYVVDYDLGTVTFTTRVPVTDDKVIRVEYEYKTFDYQRYLAGATAAVALRDSSVAVSGALWYETDNKNQPINLDLSSDDIARMRQSGDVALIRPSGRPVQADSVPRRDAFEALYVADSIGGFHYVFKPYDPQRPADNRGFYSVTFTNVSAGTGEYRDTIVDTLGRRRLVYRYVGAGRGTATALAPLPLPQQTVLGEIKARFRPATWIDAAFDIAGQNHDGNLFSTAGKSGDNGAASTGNVLVGRKTADSPGLWFTAVHRLSTRNFTKEIITPYERYRSWDDRNPDTTRGLKQSWETGIGVSAGAPISAGLSYGQLRRDSLLLTDRWSARLQSSIGGIWKLAYSGDFYRHLDSLRDGRSRVDEALQTLDLRRISLRLRAFDEWRTGGADTGRGRVGAEAGLTLRPFPLEESVSFSSSRLGAHDLPSSSDTGYTLQWKQSASGSPVNGWKLGVTANYLRSRMRGSGDRSSVLVDATDEIALPKSPFATRQDYSISLERATSYVQVPTYAGQGLGDYKRDTALGEYVPARDGDFFMQQQETYDNTGSGRVRKSKLDATWSFSPKNLHVPGLFGDLVWYGTLSVTENALDSAAPAEAWIPGYLSWSAPAGDSILQLSSFSYRQVAAWNPDGLPAFRGEVRFEPSVRKSLLFREQGADAHAELTFNGKHWIFGSEANALWIDHAPVSPVSPRYGMTDRYLELTEKYQLPRDLRIGLRETGGWAGRDSAGGWYGLLRPGLSWQPAGLGWAEASYTFSYVKTPASSLDYRLAHGYKDGVWHTVDINADVKAGDHFTVGAQYRGEFSTTSAPSHIMTVSVKATL